MKRSFGQSTNYPNVMSAHYQERRCEFLSMLLARLQSVLVCVLTTALLLTFALSLTSCVKRETHLQTVNATTQLRTARTDKDQSRPTRININTASAGELETLPGIGKALAARIIEHREKYGPFRRIEHLIIVRGISDRSFRALRELIAIE